MIKDIRYKLWLGILVLIFVGCDSMIVGEDGNEIAEKDTATFGDLVFERVELSQYGFEQASDINDQGDIVGGTLYWESDTGNLVDVGFIARALNNHGQVIGQKEYWDVDRGLVEIDVLNYTGIMHSSVHAYDINDNGEVIGEVEFCYRNPSWDDISEGYCEYDFWSMIWDIDGRATREIEWFSTAKSINNKGEVTTLSYMLAPHEIYNSFENFGPYEGYGSGEPNSINEASQVVGSISIVKKTGNNSNSLHSKGRNNEGINIENKLMRITNSNGLYNYTHVIEMIRSSDFHFDENEYFKAKGNLSKIELYNKDLNHIWDREKQQNIIEAALAEDYKSEAFIWDVENGIESLGTLGGTWSTAFDINDHGQVVGYSAIGNDEYRAFYWDQENGMIELPSNGKNSIARAINNKGQIVGENGGPVMWEVTIRD